MEHIDHDQIARTLATHSPRQGMVFNVFVTVLEIGGAVGLYQITEACGGDDVHAYLVGSIAPVLGAVAVWVRARKFSGASATIFAFTALSVVVAMVGNTDPQVLLYKDCAVTALIGVVCDASCLIARPVMYYFIQRYGTDSTNEGMAVFDQMWIESSGFRRSMYRITIAWAVVFLIQAAGTAFITASTGFGTAYIWDQVLPIVALVIAMMLSVMIGRRSQHSAKN